jgi:lipid-binding SYLF domain-containing protein
MIDLLTVHVVRLQPRKEGAMRHSIIRGCWICVMAVLAAVSPAWADTAAERLGESAMVLQEIMNAPDQGIPEDLLQSAYCVVIVPGVKNVGFIVGGKYGRGFAMCRKDNHAAWGAPAAVRIEGGSFGLQIGASATDVVMLVMDQRSIDGLLSSKFTLGGGAEVAAGPVGRSGSAQTDAPFRAKILSYSRSRGVFAGVALTGATLRQDLDENKEMYGRPVTNKQVVDGAVMPPASASQLLSLLNKYSSPTP